MNSTERKQFEDELAVLFGGFPQFLTPPRIEAYWRGLQQMSLPIFIRCVNEFLGPKAEGKLPTPNMIWQMSRKLRALPSGPAQATSQQQFDDYHCLGQKWLLGFVLKHGGVDPKRLPQLIAVKNRIVDQFRTSGEINGNVAEWLDVAMTAFDQVAA